jgi:glycosyltransferase involved in cell wall biosynthesis
MVKLISIISTCYNEELNILECYQKVKELFKNNKLNYEHIFVDNDSNDGTKKIIEDICNKDKNIKAIFNAKNYGPFLSNFNALKFANGDYIIVNYASDMQDPVEKIDELLKKIKEGYDVVYAIKNSTQDNFFLAKCRRIFYFFINKFSDSPNPENANEFMCITKKILEEIKDSNDYFPYIRGYFGRLTSNFGYIYFNRNKRINGKSKNNFFNLYTQAVNGLISTMNKPIRILSLLSLIAVFSSIVLMIYILFSKFFLQEIVPQGITFVSVITLIFFSFVMLLLSLMLEYLIAIHEQTRFKNKVFIQKKINF